MPQLAPKTTTNLTIKLLEVSSSGQVARVNEALTSIDILVQGLIKDKDLSTPPTLVDGNAYIVAGSPTGAWSGKAKSVAAAINGAWVFFTPKIGWTFMVEDEAVKYVYDGTNWVMQTIGATTAPTWTVVTKTASFTASVSEAAVYLVDATSGNITITMPAASGIGSRAIIFKRIDSSSNTVTIDPNASETIDGQASLELSSQYDSVVVISSGSNLFIL